MLKINIYECFQILDFNVLQDYMLFLTKIIRLTSCCFKKIHQTLSSSSLKFCCYPFLYQKIGTLKIWIKQVKLIFHYFLFVTACKCLVVIKYKVFKYKEHFLLKFFNKNLKISSIGCFQRIPQLKLYKISKKYFKNNFEIFYLFSLNM